MKPTNARYGVVAFALALAMIMYIQRVAISQAIVPIADDLHLTKEQTGMVLGAFGLSYALFEIPMGLLGDKLGVRWILSQLVLIWSAFTALTGAAWNLTSMWIVRFLFGAGEAGCFPNLTRMLSAWLPVSERVRAQAVMWAFGRWGGALAPPVAYFVIYHFGWRWGFVALAMLGVAWVAVFLPWFRNDPAEHKSVNKAELELLEGSRALVLHEHGVPWYKLLLQRDIALLGLQYFAFSYTWYFYVTWLPTWLQQARALDPATAAGFAMVPLALGGVGSIVSGFLPMWIPRKWVAFAGFTGTAILIFIIPQVSSVTGAMVLMGMASFCSDLTMPISWNTCVEIGKQYTATVASTMNMLGNFAGFVAPVVFGYILGETDNNWTIVMYTMAGAAIVSALCWVFLDPKKHSPDQLPLEAAPEI
ncbi:MAG: MFS transporter [Alphaproteobacteria bacterium]|nr:MFS transporter [Alphaproteobacteria bacterium]